MQVHSLSAKSDNHPGGDPGHPVAVVLFVVIPNRFWNQCTVVYFAVSELRTAAVLIGKVGFSCLCNE